ncbi:CDP-alcohol phosphatidyltransferase [Streptomyces sp. NBC_00576]|uniref:CDP-alcohol phosphatidyltransferase n=1 Tax=Streptomyces sp. NBC_00576 TaxID=2903665 RepID=UPI002E808CCE|nr:CDP-alcohol phosphatidyltransferase [Streptomyces sp. NBC_00576]WUB74552.1 CDP-alcohol phosphatidyltransferase [Streptomyces sp. NBC_00576]
MPLFTRIIPSTDATTDATTEAPSTETPSPDTDDSATETPAVSEATDAADTAAEAGAATEVAKAGAATEPSAATEVTEPSAATKATEPTEAGAATEPSAATEVTEPGAATEVTAAAEASAAAETEKSPKPGWRTRRPTVARNLSWAVTGLSALLVLVALQLPATADQIRLSEFFRIPAEAIVAAVVLLAMPRRPRVITAACIGVFLGALTVVNLLDMGYVEYLGRHFNVMVDWELLSDAQSYLTDSIGAVGSIATTLGVIVLVLLLLVGTGLATVRLSNLLARHNAGATKASLIAGTVWITCMSLGLTNFGGAPLASNHATAIVEAHVQRVHNSIRDEAVFEKLAKKDPFAKTPPDQLVPDLRGKDVIFTFIESYGRSAIEDPVMSPGVDRTLADQTQALTDAGFAAKSGWLTSATYGGSSWLGHSTFLSGLWISTQQRYRTLVNSDRLTLPEVFRRTDDFRVVGVMPGVQKSWPEAKFYGLEKNYAAKDLGYKGPKFSWSTMPDQYTLEAYQRLEHGRKQAKPLMSEIILTSSHQPWAPLPKTVPQDQLGDGSVFNAIQKAGKDPKDVLYDGTKAKEEYGKSIQYSVTSLIDWLTRYGTDNTVLVFLGDHQPMARVSGNDASRDVPVSVVAKDPKILDKISDWNWTDGLRPADDAPVWKMDAFRDKFLTAYGSTPHP